MNEFWGKYSPNLLLADLHVHTTGSDGLMSPKNIVDLANKIGLSAIAITDHEVIHPATEAKKYCLAKGYDLEVAIGSEITTKNGHLMGLFLKEEIPSGKSVEWTIQQIHDQNGLVIAPHPFFGLFSLKKAKILSLIDNQNSGIYFDGFEIFNGGVYDLGRNQVNHEAKSFYEKYIEFLGAPIGGTDAHYFTVGRTVTGYEGSLRKSLEERKTQVFYQDEKESVELFDVAKQFYVGLILEPSRRFCRFMRRQAKTSILKNNL